MPKMFRQLSHFAITNLLIVLLASTLAAQSTDQNFPTPVRDSEISGAIKARDVGDARLTSHFYTFQGGQGDLFINVQTTNFTGDVDVYVIPGLRPLTKMVMYADGTGSETGRVIYLRKPETILLRISGRTPGDEEATYRIKFAGSFVASRVQGEVPELPRVDSDTQSNIRVNSVGTIIEVIPKATPVPNEESTPLSAETVSEYPEKSKTEETPEPVKQTDVPTSESRPERREVVVSDPLADKGKNAEKSEESAGASSKRSSRARRNPPTETTARKGSDGKSPEKKETPQKDTGAPDVSASNRGAEPPKKSKTERTKADDRSFQIYC